MFLSECPITLAASQKFNKMPVMLGFTHDELLDFSDGTNELFSFFFFEKYSVSIRFGNYFLRFVDLFFSFFFLFTGLYRIINNTADALKEMFNLKLDLLGPYESVKELSVVMFLTLRLKISKQ